MRLSTFRRFVTAAEPASHVFTFTKSSTATAAGIVAYRGVHPTSANPIDVHGGQVTTKAANWATARSTTVTVQGDMLMTVFGSANDAAATPPTGMTERYDRLSAGSSNVATTADDQKLTATGATGVRTAMPTSRRRASARRSRPRPAP